MAAFEVYFVVGSLLFKAAVPPFDWKNLVADSLPPTFMIRNWSHCHSANCVRSLPLGEYCRATYGQDLWIAQTRYGHPSFGDLRSSPGKGRFQKVLTSMLDSSARNQSISKGQIYVSDFTPGTKLTCGMLTRFAGFVLSFSKIFCDWDFEASAAIFAVLRRVEELICLR